MRSAERGFTLVEVMVAMGVLGLAVLALIRLGAANASTASRIESAMLGDIVAENLVVDALTAPQPPPYGTTRGFVVNSGLNWSVVQEIARTKNPRLMRISIDVSDESGDPAGSLTAFRGLRPTTDE